MKNLKSVFAIPAMALLAACTNADVPAPEAIGPLPSAYQMNWHKMETYAFIHFGLNTFADKEWGFGDNDLDIFNPTDCNVEQWVQTLKAAGMTGVVLTCKHHDGFCLWPTQLTEYCIRNTPYKDGKGDIVGELRAACDKYGLKLGLYLSPWDRNASTYGTPEYVEYYNQQLEELTTQYGTLFEFWLDGANGGDGYYGGANETRKIDRRNYYNFPNLFAHILKNQPQAIIFSDGGPGCRWVGNENGIASATNWAFLRQNEVFPGYPDYPTLQYGHDNGDAWIPAECDVSIRPGWFYHETEDDKVKSAEQLVDLYYRNVGHNANFILNFPVDKTGRINKIDSTNAVTFRQIIEKELANDILHGIKPEVSDERGGNFVASAITDDDYDSYWATKDSVKSATISFTFPKQKVNRMMLQEYIPLGQRVKRFTVEYRTQAGEWAPISLNEETSTIGYKRLLRFQTLETDGLRVNIEDARGCLCINHIGAYWGGDGSDVQFVDKGENFDSAEFELKAEKNQFVLNLGTQKVANVLHWLPSKDGEGLIHNYEIWAGDTETDAKMITMGEFSNIEHNPLLQTIRFAPTRAKVIILKATKMVKEGEAVKAEKLGIELF